MGSVKAAGQSELETFLWPEGEGAMEEDWERNQVIVLILLEKE